MSQSGGWEGRRSHVKWPHCRPPRGKREHSISSFQHISLWRGERRHAVQGKQCGSWRGGPHVVCVSGRLDLEGFTPSGSQSLLSQKSQSRPWRPPCAGSLGSHVVLGTAHNDIPGTGGHGSLSLETLPLEELVWLNISTVWVLADMPRGAHLPTSLFFLQPLRSRSAFSQSDFLISLPAIWPAPVPPHW